MQERHLFEYAVIRVVPRVEREEFINVGIILYCRDRKFLDATLELNERRLEAIGGCASEELKSHLTAFQRISRGEESAGPIARLDQASRFRWLTAARSSVVQTSCVHAGFCKDPGETLARLHKQLVTD